MELIVLALPSVELSILRVGERVAHGGHNVPWPVLERRFPRSIRLLLDAYAPAMGHALCTMNTGAIPMPVFVQTGPEHKRRLGHYVVTWEDGRAVVAGQDAPQPEE